VDVRVSADRFEISGEEGTHAVGGGLVVAGRFDLDELADGLDDFFLAGLEVEEAIAPRWVWWGLFRNRFFPARHFFDYSRILGTWHEISAAYSTD